MNDILSPRRSLFTWPVIIGAAAWLLSAVLIGQSIVQAAQSQELRLSLVQGQSLPTQTVHEPTLRDPHQLPTVVRQSDVSAVIGELHRLATLVRLPLKAGRYERQMDDALNASAWQIVLPVRAKYPAVRTFVSMALNEMPALSLRQLTIERASEKSAEVSATIGFTLIIRDAS